jgi:signal transduction histidine kinase
MTFQTRPGEQDDEWAKVSKRFYRQAIPLTLLGNCLIAGFLTVSTNTPLWENLVYAHTIGLSILVLHLIGHRLIRGKDGWHWAVTVVALPLGSGFGLLFSWWVLTGTIRGHLHSLPFAIATTIILGGAVTYYFWTRAHLALAEAQRQAQHQAHERDREEGARRLAETELRLLQAQIEPHFLFNTLSNVLSLIDGDPPRAKRMLLDLTSYLRASLRRTRATSVTVGEELDLVRAYLGIQAVRMGARLRWEITCPDDLRELTLPPLLLQPLVENSLKHGLEPRPQGGAVSVRAAREGEALVLEVRDDGLGLDPHRPAGVGLGNVRKRVEAVTAGQGTLTLLPRPEGGLCVRIVLPLPLPAPGAPAPAAPASPDGPAPRDREVSA